MKRRDWLVAGAAGVASVGGWGRAGHAQPASHSPLLPFAMPWPARLMCLEGVPWQPPNLASNSPHPKAVILVFWSITCPFCERHHPAVQALHEASSGLALSVVSTALEAGTPAGREALTRHLQQRSLSFPVLIEHDRLRSIFGTRRVTPTTVAIDRTGLVREIIPGLMAAEDVAALGRTYG